MLKTDNNMTDICKKYIKTFMRIYNDKKNKKGVRLQTTSYLFTYGGEVFRTIIDRERGKI